MRIRSNPGKIDENSAVLEEGDNTIQHKEDEKYKNNPASKPSVTICIYVFNFRTVCHKVPLECIPCISKIHAKYNVWPSSFRLKVSNAWLVVNNYPKYIHAEIFPNRSLSVSNGPLTITLHIYIYKKNCQNPDQSNHMERQVKKCFTFLTRYWYSH